MPASSGNAPKSVLIVDDEQILLESYAFAIGTRFSADTALGPDQGLARLAMGDTYAVVVSDMNMPRMSGAEFLSKVRDRWPDSVRIMLTGARDQHTAIAAVNEGSVFRFLTKPCSAEELLRAVTDAVRQHELIVAERELLEKTLKGTIQILTDMLAVADPAQLIRSQRLRDRVTVVAQQLRWKNRWEVELAAMLRHVGAMTLPPGLLLKTQRGQIVVRDELALLNRLPEFGRTLLARIPRLENVAEIVLYQNKQFDGVGFPHDAVAGEKIPAGARLIKILSDFADLEARAYTPSTAIREMVKRTGWYDPEFLTSVESAFAPVVEGPGRAISIRELRVGQKLAASVETSDVDTVVAAAGYTITEPLLLRLQNLAAFAGLKEPIFVHDLQPDEKPVTAGGLSFSP